MTLLSSCKKELRQKQNDRIEQSIQPPPGGGECDLNTTVCLDCAFQEQIEDSDDSTNYPTVLGDVYQNPYAISVMTDAYNSIHGTNIQALTATHFKNALKAIKPAQSVVIDQLFASYGY